MPVVSATPIQISGTRTPSRSRQATSGADIARAYQAPKGAATVRRLRSPVPPRYQRIMRWTPGGRSGDLEDQRGGRAAVAMVGGGLRIGAGGAVLLLVLSLATGQNFFAILGNVIDVGGGDERRPGE